MTQQILEQTKQKYSEVRAIYENSGYSKSYKLNTFWSCSNMNVMTEILEEASTAEEAVHAIQKTWLFSVNTADSIKEKAVDWLLSRQQRVGLNIFELPEEIQDSRFSYPGNIAERKGRKVSPDFLRTVSIGHEIKKHINDSEGCLKVLELGAGCGHLARTLSYLFSNVSYCILDIPETLCFSYLFLSLNFPEAKTLFVTKKGQLENSNLDEYDFIFIPTMFAPEIEKKSFDLFINTASLGEMDNEVIRYWMDFVQNKIQIKYLFTLNRYLNTILTQGSHDWRLKENECSVHYDSDWLIHSWELEPLFTRCPYVDTAVARYLQIFAERKPSFKSDKEKKQESLNLVREVRSEDWIRWEKKYDEVMTARDQIFVRDMTMEGTLYKIWNSIRLHPMLENIFLILKYLETLCHLPDRELEETIYYEQLFLKLSEAQTGGNRKFQRIVKLIEMKRDCRRRQLPLPSYFNHPRGGEKKPVLLESNYNDYNLVQLGPLCFAMHVLLGDMNLAELGGKKLRELEDKEMICRGELLWDVKSKVDRIQSRLSKDKSDKEISRLLTSLTLKGDDFSRAVNNFKRLKNLFRPILIEGGLQGFNIIRYRGLFYVVAQSINGFEIENLDSEKIISYQSRNQLAVGRTLKQAKEIIKIFSSESFQCNVAGNPKIIEEGLEGFNLIQFRGLFYVVAQGLENFDIENLDSEKIVSYQAKSQMLVAQTIKQAKEIIEIISSGVKYDTEGKPKIVEEGYQGFNIVEYKGVFFVIAQGVNLDVEKLTSILIVDFQSKFQLAVARTIEQAKEITGFMMSRKSQLETDGARRDKVNARWKAEAELEKKKAQELDKQVSGYESTVAELKEMFGEKDQQFEDLEVKFATLSAEMLTVEQALKQKDLDLLELLQAGKEKDTRLDGFKSKIEELSAKVKELELALKDKEGELQGLAELAKEKDRQFQELEIKLENHSIETAKVELTLKGKEDELQKLLEAEKVKDKEILFAQSELNRLSRKIDAYKEQVNWDVERIESLLKMVCTKNEEIIRLSDAIR